MEAELKGNEADQVVVNFRDAFKKLKEYIRHIKTIPENKRTMKQKELWIKFRDTIEND